MKHRAGCKTCSMGKNSSCATSPKLICFSSRYSALRRFCSGKHPQYGIIALANFLPPIKHTGLRVSVGDWVLQRGLQQLSKWQSEGLNIMLSANISARRLQEANSSQRLIELGCLVGQGKGIARITRLRELPGWMENYVGTDTPTWAITP